MFEDKDAFLENIAGYSLLIIEFFVVFYKERRRALLYVDEEVVVLDNEILLPKMFRWN